MPESQFNYLFTLKNAHLSSNSYKFRMQPNIPMKFAGYVARILLCKLCKFGEKIYYNSGDIEFFLGDYFFWRALYPTTLTQTRSPQHTDSSAALDTSADISWHYSTAIWYDW